MKEIVNLTPHPVKIILANDITLEFPPSEQPARANEKRIKNDEVEYNQFCIPVNEVQLGDVKNLPEPNPDTIYIVSRIVADACPDRNDLYIPDETVRDNEGNIKGCRALAQV